MANTQKTMVGKKLSLKQYLHKYQVWTCSITQQQQLYGHLHKMQLQKS